MKNVENDIFVGIDAIGLAFPQYTLDLSELALARGVPPSKYTEGLGTLRMCVPAIDEDAVTLAVGAARDALRANHIRPEEIGLCIVGTETAVDHSKPIAAFVHGLLGLSSACRVFETKHACFGGTAGLMNAVDWIRAGSAGEKKALVICTDIARYGIGTAGEPTQGAGAVAMIVSKAPRLLALDRGRQGIFAQDVFDFWRPLYSKDAFVDGQFSVNCYLDALSGAYAGYRAAAGASATALYSDQFAAIAYHVPYGKMARKAHRRLREVDGDTAPDASFATLVQDSLRLPNLVGNIYTGSLYLALASLLEKSQRPLAGKRIALFSYGSGSCAEFFSGVVGPEAQAWAQSRGWSERLASRQSLSVEAYEKIMSEREQIDQRPAQAAVENPEVRYHGVRDHRRVYR